MTTKTKALLWIISVVTAFLLGFVPQYLQKQRVRNELQATNEQVLSLQLDSHMAELRTACGAMLLEVLRHNYGTAKDYSGSYFEKLRESIESSQNASHKKGLEELLGNRDSVVAALAQADPASASQIQALCLRTYEITRNP